MIRILCRGPLDWTLGSEYLLLAMRELLDRGVEARLCIAGDGPERERILFTIHDLELDDAVRLVSGEMDPDALFADADVFVLVALGNEKDNEKEKEKRPDLSAALLAGLPVVSSPSVPSRDPSAICQALARLSGDTEGSRTIQASASEVSG